MAPLYSERARSTIDRPLESIAATANPRPPSPWRLGPHYGIRMKRSQVSPLEALRRAYIDYYPRTAASRLRAGGSRGVPLPAEAPTTVVRRRYQSRTRSPRFEIAVVVLYMRGCMLCDTIVGARQWIGGRELTSERHWLKHVACLAPPADAPARRARSATSASDGRPLG